MYSIINYKSWKYTGIWIALLIIGIACGSKTVESNSTNVPTVPVELESPDIQGVVEGMENGTVFLIGALAGQQFKADSSSIVSAGSFHFKKEASYKPGLYYVYLPDRTAFQLLIDADQTMDIKTQKGNLVMAMEITGNLENEILYTNLKFQEQQQPEFTRISNGMKSVANGSPDYQQLKAEQEKLLQIRAQHLKTLFDKYPNSFFTSFKRAGQNPNVEEVYKSDGSIDRVKQVALYRSKFWDGVDFNDERLLSTPVISNKLKRFMDELTIQHQDSINASVNQLINRVDPQSIYFKYFVNWVLLKYDPAKTTLMDPESVFVNVVQNYFTYEKAPWADSVQVYGAQLRATEMAGSLVGNKGPDVQANDPNGQLKSLLAIQAPYIVVYMFNPDCEHCKEETPRLVDFYRKWKSQGVEVFAIGVNTTTEEWKDYVKANKMTWTNVFDQTNRAIYGKYYVNNTPEIYVLNPDRTIIAKNLQVFQIETVINQDKQKRSS